MVFEDDTIFDHHSMLQNKATMQNNVIMKRKEQLKHWELSEVNKMTAIRKPVDQAKVKFQDSDVFLSACISGDEDEVEDLLDNGANINVATIDGVTALHQAVIDDNFEIVRFLIEHKADINAQDNEGWTPLHAAVCCGSLPIAKYLCEKGADLTLTNSDKELAIDLAEDDAIRLHLENQLQINNIDIDKCRDCEYNLIMKDCSDWIRNGRYLDKPHFRTGATALHVAASKGYNQLIGMLLRAGADINVQDNEGWTPLHAAAHWAEKDACRILIENGANVECENYIGQTVFMVADKSIIDYLKELQQPFSDRSNILLDHQIKETLREPLSEKKITFTNKNTSSNDLQSFSLNKNNSCQIENDVTSNITGLIAISSSNNLPNTSYTSTAAKTVSLVVQPTTQYAGCTPKPTINNTRFAPVVESEEINEEQYKEKDVICKKKDEEVLTETIGSLSLLKKTFSSINNTKISNENIKNVEILDKKSNSAISTLDGSSRIKKFAESERQSSIASTSSFSEDTTGSNISSIVTTSHSVTSKEDSSGLYSSDQEIECTISVHGKFQSKKNEPSNLFCPQIQKKKKNGSDSERSFPWSASTVSSSSLLTLETNSAVSGALVRHGTQSLNSQNAHSYNQFLNDKNFKQNNTKSLLYSSKSSSNSLSLQTNSSTELLKKDNLTSNSSTETLSNEKTDDLLLKGFSINSNMLNQTSLSTKVNNQLKNSNRFDECNLLDTPNKTTINRLENRLLKPTIATFTKTSAKILPSEHSNVVLNSPNSIVQSFTSFVKDQSLPVSLKPALFSIANGNCSANNQSYIINNNLKTSSYTPPMQPSLHKESESERKAKSRLQRHSRRSTQGVTLEHVNEAARQIQGSTSSSSIDDNEQKNSITKNLEDNEKLLTIDVEKTYQLSEKEIASNSMINSCLRYENNNINNNNNNNNGFKNLSKWRLQTAATSINNSLEEKKTFSSFSPKTSTMFFTNPNNFSTENKNTNVSAYFKLPLQNYVSASSSTSSLSSKAKNDLKSTSPSSNYSISSTSNQTSTVSSGKLNRRSQIVRGNRRRTGPVDMEAINVASSNKFLFNQDENYASQEEKKTSLKPLISRFKSESNEVNTINENFSQHDSLQNLKIDLINYKLLYKKECETSESLRKRIDELNQRTTIKQNSTTITNAIDDQERRSFERRIAALEYEIEKTKQLQLEHDKLKDENLALIRVLKKLSK